MKSKSMTRRMSLLAAIAMLPTGLVAGVTGEQVKMEKEGVQLIRQLERAARDIRSHAGLLDSFSGTTLISKRTHFFHLDQIKTVVNNDLGPTLARLAEIQAQLPDWKQENIDKMLAAAKALASHTEGAIQAKNDAGTLPALLNAEYRERIEKLYGHAHDLVKTADAAGDYGSARLKAYDAGITVPAA